MCVSIIGILWLSDVFQANVSYKVKSKKLFIVEQSQKTNY